MGLSFCSCIHGWVVLLFKFKYERNKKDGLWHITANYDTPFGSGFGFMLNVIHEGYFEPQIFGERDMKRYMEAMREVVQVSRGVTETPKNCEVCHSKLRPVIYNPGTSKDFARIRNGRAIEGGITGTRTPLTGNARSVVKATKILLTNGTRIDVKSHMAASRRSANCVAVRCCR